MSSVLIRGMEMPNICAYCFIDSSECNLHESVNIWKERHPDCPCIEVKTPHGKLIDTDMIEYENWHLDETGESYKMVGKDDIDGMSAIIEAEE